MAGVPRLNHLDIVVPNNLIVPITSVCNDGLALVLMSYTSYFSSSPLSPALAATVFDLSGSCTSSFG